MRYFQKNSSNHILDVVKFLAVLAYGPNVNDEDTPIIGNAASKEEDMYLELVKFLSSLTNNRFIPR